MACNPGCIVRLYTAGTIAGSGEYTMLKTRITDKQRRPRMSRFLAAARQLGVEQVNDAEAQKAVQLLSEGFEPEAVARSFYLPPVSDV